MVEEFLKNTSAIQNKEVSAHIIPEDSIRYVSDFLFSEKSSSQLKMLSSIIDDSSDIELQRLLQDATANVSAIVSEKDEIYRELLSSLDLAPADARATETLKEELLQALKDLPDAENLSPSELIDSLESFVVNEDLKKSLLSELESQAGQIDASPSKLLEGLLSGSEELKSELRLELEALENTNLLSEDIKNDLLQQIESLTGSNKMTPSELLENLDTEALTSDSLESLTLELEAKIKSTDLSADEVLDSIFKLDSEKDSLLQLKSNILGKFQKEMEESGFSEDEISEAWGQVLSKLDEMDPEDSTGIFSDNKELIDFIQKFDSSPEYPLEEEIYTKLINEKELNKLQFDIEGDDALLESGNVDKKKGKGLADGARVYADSALSRANASFSANNPSTQYLSSTQIDKEIQKEISASELCALSELSSDEVLGTDAPFSGRIEEKYSTETKNLLNTRGSENTKHIRIEYDGE